MLRFFLLLLLFYFNRKLCESKLLTKRNRALYLIVAKPGLAPGYRDWGGGGVLINFGGARELYLCEYESVDQTIKMKTKKKRTSVQKCPSILIFI